MTEDVRPGDAPAEERDLVLITGMSGAGRSEALHTFEDLGYFCIDNLPPALLGQLVELAALPGSRIHKVAVVCDVRGGAFFDELMSAIAQLEERGERPRILFLTADAYGVLPPVSRLNKDQAMLWFLMGYTSKLAGTETGVTEPQATFSRFFGQPFMPAKPAVYAAMLGEKMEKHKTRVYLINTGWSGGAYGTGRRIDITLTRKMVNAALNGELERVEYISDDRFHVDIPRTCPGVPAEMLVPENTWSDKQAYTDTANKLARQFSDHFDRAYGNQDISESIVRQCPGK